MSRHQATRGRLFRASIELAVVRLVSESPGILHYRALSVGRTHEHYGGRIASETPGKHSGRLARDHGFYVFFQEGIDIGGLSFQKLEGLYSRSNEGVVSPGRDSTVHLAPAEQ